MQLDVILECWNSLIVPPRIERSSRLKSLKAGEGIKLLRSSDLIYLGHAYAMSGKRDEALSILNKLKTTKEYVSPADLAILYAGLGDKEAAFQSLERAYSMHDLQMPYLKVLPHYDPLRSDPRFADLMRRVGLTP